jgi:hypothetical protein
MHIELETRQPSLFNSYFKGNILSNKPFNESGSRRKDGLDQAAEEAVAGSTDEAEILQQAEQEVRERRNGYQRISTDAYYQTERRIGYGQDGLDGATEVDGADMDGVPYSEGDMNR